MRFQSLLLEISLTPVYLLGVFLLLLLAFDLVLVRLLKLCDLAWKRVDYVWLLVALLGVLSVSSHGDRELSASLLEMQKRPTEFSYKTLRDYLIEGGGVCFDAVRSKDSPPYFDAMTAEERALCKQSREIAAAMPSSLPADGPPLETMGYKTFGQGAKYESQFVATVGQYAKEYSDNQLQYARLASHAKESTGDQIYQFLGPLLLALAVALRMTKVTGEIVNAKRRRGGEI
jgi:hypothetical protein